MPPRTDISCQPHLSSGPYAFGRDTLFFRIHPCPSVDEIDLCQVRVLRDDLLCASSSNVLLS